MTTEPAIYKKLYEGFEFIIEDRVQRVSFLFQQTQFPDIQIIPITPSFL